jgi:integrase
VFRGDRDVPAGSCASPQTIRPDRDPLTTGRCSSWSRRDHVARHAGIENAQALLGHADVGTTQMYTGAPTLDELARRSRATDSGWNEHTFRLTRRFR